MKKIWKITSVLISTIYLTAAVIYALPSGESIESGSASFNRPNDTTLNVTASDGTVINFNNFDIGQNEIVNFYSADPALAGSTNVLSRVMSPTATGIAGMLNAHLTYF